MYKLPTITTTAFYTAILTFSIFLTGCGGGGGGAAAVPAAVDISVSDASVTEGDAGTANLDFTVTLSEASEQEVSVDYVTEDGTASAGSDYTSATGTLTIPAGSTSGTITVVVSGDVIFETDETITLTLSNSTNADLSSAIATGSITNDDTAPSLSIADASVVEGNTGTTNLALVVTLSAASGAETTVDYVTANGTAIAGSDYNVITAATLTIPAGSTTGTINIAVFTDIAFEFDETLNINLSNPINAILGTATAIATITNDDLVPGVSVAAASVAEGNTGTTNMDFTVTLSAISGINTAVDYATSNVTALAGDDYTASSGTLIIPAGSTTGTITVAVSGDVIYETDETLIMTLTNPVNAILGIAAETGTISNDEAVPGLSIANASIAEGNAGTSNMNFTVTLSSASSVNTTVNYTTTNGGLAVAGSDYTATSGTLNIPSGVITAIITVVVSGDTLFEADETFNVVLSNPVNATLATAIASGTITNDDTAPSLSIANVSVVEGDAGTTNMNFTITLSAVSGIDATVNVATSDGTALVGSDYTATSGMFTISAGSTTRIVTVFVSGDTAFEPDETLTVTLSNPANATIATATATGTINNDDVTPVTMTISGKSLDFAWGTDSFTGIAAANIDHYRILVNPDGASGFTVIPTASNITALSQSIEISVHTTNWLSAQYIVEACDLTETICGTSANQTLSLIDSVAATIYVKPTVAAYTESRFSWSVALSDDGNTLAVGAYLEDSSSTGIGGNQTNIGAIDSGAVYVYVKNGTTWSPQAYIKASNTTQNNYFGYSVSLSSDGNTLAVGAEREDSVAVVSGAAYVFTRTGTTWSQQALLKSSNAETFDFFGYTVSLSSDGNTLAVGAYGEDSAATGIGGAQANNTATNAGAVYVFIRSGISWSSQAYIKASNTESNDEFGRVVSLNNNGNVLIVGAPNEDSTATGIAGNQTDNTATDSGAVYVFSRTGTTWAQQDYVKASNTGASDLFGWSIDLSDDGNTMVIGAYAEASNATGAGGNQTDNSTAQAGAVYIFANLGGSWSQQAYVKASNTEANDRFGFAISLSADGNTLAVGADSENSIATGVGGSQADNTAVNAGATYVFTRSGVDWSQENYVKAPNTDAGDRFGYSVAVTNDSLAVGAFGEDSTATGINGDQTADSFSTAERGAVYLY